MINDTHKIVEKFFKKKRFNVFNANKNIKANGVDLVVGKNKKSWSVEVKKASKSSRTWRVQFLSSQYKSDLIAIVMPNKDVILLSGRIAKLSSNKSNILCLGVVPDVFS